MENELDVLLKRYRGLWGLTLRQVEEQTGISTAYLSQLENVLAENPSLSIISKLADLYKVPISHFLSAAGYEIF